MSLNRLLSLVASLALHAGVVAAALVWPAPQRTMIDLTAPTIDVDIIYAYKPAGAPDAPQAPAAPQVPQTPPEPPQAPETPQPPETPPAPPEPQVPETPPVPVPAPDPVPEPPKPEPPKPEPPKPEPPKPEPPKPVPPKPQTPRTPAGPRTSTRPGTSSVDSALSALGQQSSIDDALSSLRGEGGTTVGLKGTYMQSLVSRIQPNWGYVRRADRRNPTAVAEIHLASDGRILDARIVESSGDAAFDGSVRKAILDTRQVEPPPSADLHVVRLPFAYQGVVQR